jgi:hypothetical protein
MVDDAVRERIEMRMLMMRRERKVPSRGSYRY